MLITTTHMDTRKEGKKGINQWHKREDGLFKMAGKRKERQKKTVRLSGCDTIICLIRWWEL